MDSGQIDNLFLGILQNCGQIEPFLEVVFSFLARRTDFFRIMHSKDDKMGFPEGVAEEMVLKIFKKYQRIINGNTDVSKGKKRNKPESKAKEKTNYSTINNVQSKQEKQEKQEENLNSESLSLTGKSDGVPTVVESTVEVTSSNSEHNASEQSSSSEVQDITPEASSTVSTDSVSSTHTASSEKSTESESKLLEPGKLPDCYNGAVLDKYTWSQTIKDIDIKVPLPKCIQRAKDVTVEIKSSSLKICLRGNYPPEEFTTRSNVLVDGELQRTIKCEESMWSLEPGKCVQVNLEKTEERFWTCVLRGDPEIDKTKVDSTRNIEDFDDQTQTDFQQVMYDHHQKMMGKPTSKQQKTSDLLEKAWNAKGSPFAGTPFDPTSVNISG